MSNVKQSLEQLHLTIEGENYHEYRLFCPFHSNTDTPAFWINKKTGRWLCYNPSCNKRGNLNTLFALLGEKKDSFYEQIDDDDILALLQEDKVADDNWGEAMERVKINYSSDEVSKLNYLIDRGIRLVSLKAFEIGFSDKKNRIVIPVRDENHRLIGFIGRAISNDINPKYLYSKGFSRGQILFNLNNAKRFHEVVVVEGSIDAIKVHQSGYQNVVSTLGANVTDQQISLLKQYFNKVIIFHDNDDAGEGMMRGILNRLPELDIYIVDYSGMDEKDPGECSEDQIRGLIENAVDQISWEFYL